MPVITKYLRPVDYGIYGIITSYLFFVTALKDLGFATVFVNTFYKFPKRWKIIWRMLHGHLLIWGVIYALVLILVLVIGIPREAKHNLFWIATLTIIPSVIFDNTNTLGNYYFRFSQKPLFITIVSIVTGISAIIITFVSVVYFRLGYMSWFVATFGSALIMF